MIYKKSITVLEYNAKTFQFIKEWDSISSVARALGYKEFRTISRYLDSNEPLKGRLWYRKNSWT